MKEFESALQAIDTALELDPRLALAHADKGSLLIALGRDEDAVRSLDLALGLGLDEPVAEACYARKGRALASSGKYEQALAVYNQAIARYPHSIEFLIEKVAMLHALKRTKEAFAVLKEASKLDPQNALIPYTEGELYRTSRRYQSALAAYDRAIQYQPDFAAAYVGKGITLGETGEHGRAGVLFEYALKLDPQNIDARNHLSNVFLILQQPQKALEIDETAIQLNPNLAELHRKRGLALEDLERYPEALAAYEKAIELDPNVADTHHDKGVLLDKMDQPEAALEALC
jgi:tetratricopeptide (TPR) repeat protein